MKASKLSMNEFHKRLLEKARTIVTYENMKHNPIVEIIKMIEVETKQNTEYAIKLFHEARELNFIRGK